MPSPTPTPCHLIRWLALATALLLCAGGLQAANVYSYDDSGRLLQATYSDGRQVSYSYDAAGNMRSIATRTGSAPAVIITDPVTGRVGDPITPYTLRLSSSAGLKGFVISGLPAGLTADLTTGVISGTPLAGGSFYARVQARSNLGLGAPVRLPFLITNPFTDAAVPGTLKAVLTPGGLAPLGGTLEVSLQASGAFTGKLLLGGNAAPLVFKGHFNSAGTADVLIPRGTTTPIALRLFVGLAASPSGVGSLNANLWEGAPGGPGATTAFGWRNMWTPANPPSPLFLTPNTGRYVTVFDLPSAGVGDPALPQGDGWASFTLAKSGIATITGQLADGTAWTASAVLLPDGQLPIFVPLYGGKGALTGTFQINTGSEWARNTVGGAFTWIKPNVTATKPAEKNYPRGFGTRLDATGGSYTTPATGTRILDLGSGSSQSRAVSFEAVNAAGTAKIVDANLTISPRDAVTPVPPLAGLLLTPARATARLNGSFKDPASGQTVKVSGLMLPAVPGAPARIFGHYLLPGGLPSGEILSGQIYLGPPTP